MPKIRITELPQTSSMAPTDIFPMVNVDADATYKITLQDLSSNLTEVQAAIYATTAGNGGVTSVSAGTGLYANTTTGDVTLVNTGVTSVSSGNGISVDTTTGDLTVTNDGVTSVSAGTGISVDVTTGDLTVTNDGVTSIIAGSGISVDTSTGAVTITNTGGGGGGTPTTYAEEGGALGTATFVNFIGSGVTATVSSNTASITIPGASANDITFADEGGALGTATFVNFIGAGVTATVSSNTASITIPGGGGAGSAQGLDTQIQYNNATALDGVPTLTYDGTTLRGTGSFSGSFTGTLTGTASLASKVANPLSQGSGVTTFSYDGSSAQTVAVSGTLGMAVNAITKWTGAAFTASTLTDNGTTITGASSIQLTGANSSLTGSFSGSFKGSGSFTGILDISTLGAGQIKFPATPTLSSDPNTLDDYEEGTWNPIYIPQTGGFGSVTFVNDATYQKIGKKVYIQGYLYTSNLTIGTAAGNLYLSGLPFSWNTGQLYSGPMVTFVSVLNWASEPPSMGRSGGAGSTSFNLYRQRDTTTAESVLITPADMQTGVGAYNQAYFFGFYDVL